MFGFLPFLLSSAVAEQFESGNTLTAAGLALGLTNANGNFSHNIFTSRGGMNVVATNPNGAVLSLDFRGDIGSGGVTPEPGDIRSVRDGARFHGPHISAGAPSGLNVCPTRSANSQPKPIQNGTIHGELRSRQASAAA